MEELTKMDWLTFILALVGTLSWVPFLINHFIKSKVDIYLDKTIQLVTNEFNSVVTTRIGIHTKNKDAFIENIKLTFHHESGDTKTYTWVMIVEPISQTHVADNLMPTNKVFNAIGFKSFKDSFTEPVISFINRDFRNKYDELSTRIRIKRFYLVKSKLPLKQIETDESFIELCNLYKKSYHWIAGKYECQLLIETSEKKRITKRFSFNIDSLESETISRLNIDMVLDKMKTTFSREESEKIIYDDAVLNIPTTLNIEEL